MRDQQEKLYLSKVLASLQLLCLYSVVLQASPPSSAPWQGPGAPKARTSATAPPTG